MSNQFSAFDFCARLSLARSVSFLGYRLFDDKTPVVGQSNDLYGLLCGLIAMTLSPLPRLFASLPNGFGFSFCRFYCCERLFIGVSVLELCCCHINNSLNDFYNARPSQRLHYNCTTE